MNANILSLSVPGLAIGVFNLLIFWDSMSPKWPVVSWTVLCGVLLLWVGLKILLRKLSFVSDNKEPSPQIAYADIETELRYAIEEAFTGDFTSLKERFRLEGTKLFEPASLERLMDLRKELFEQFRDEVFKKVL